MKPSQQQPGDRPPRRADTRSGRRHVGSRTTPGGLEQRLLARARRAGFGPGDRVVVAFSGGRDSLALGAGLRWVRDVLDVELLLVHVDHRLREGSEKEAARAADLAEALGLEMRGLATEGSPHEMHPGIGIEEAARQERYRLLFEVARAEEARAVATGHHEQDQAETVLLHLLRGGGVHGAAGMSERSVEPVGSSAAHDISQEVCSPWLWRPMLSEQRAAIDAYVDQLGLDWVEDPSNADMTLRRNVVRGRIIPLLESEFPGATAALARYARLAAADDEALEQIVQVALEGQVDPGGRLRVASLEGLSLAAQRRAVRRWFGDRAGSQDLSAERTDAILDLVFSGRGERSIEAGGGWAVSLHEGMLRARRAEAPDEGDR